MLRIYAANPVSIPNNSFISQSPTKQSLSSETEVTPEHIQLGLQNNIKQNNYFICDKIRE